MFGLMRGASRAMTGEERLLWMGHICGLCIALRDNAGQLGRVATNYDAALLSVLITAQSAENTPTQTTYCPLRRQRTMAITAPTSDASRYGAALALLMGGTKIEDHIIDKDGAWHRWRLLSQPLSQRWLAQGGKLAEQVRFDPQLVRDHTSQQTDIEAQAAETFSFYAEPTMEAAAAVFAHTARLANVPQNEKLMAEIGRNFGLITYLLDAYQDIADDVKAGHFNPLVQLYAPHERQPAAQSEFKEAHLALRRAVYQLELAQPTLLRKLLVHSLQTIGERTLGMARRCGKGGCRIPALASSAEFDQDQVDHIKRLKDEESRKATQDVKSADCFCCDSFCCYSTDCGDCCDCFTCCEAGNSATDSCDCLSCCDVDCCNCANGCDVGCCECCDCCDCCG